MKPSLMQILACPKCKHHPLDLKVIKEEGGEVIEGEITCPRCRIDYPIEDAIPNMLLPEER
ncbi:MAG: Trm112 family protein [Methanomassiliicoccales archaeon]